jgi:GT2 family glycosyltransferase
VIYFLTVNYYSTNSITKLINSIRSSRDSPYKIVIVNNSPDDETIHLVQDESVVILESGSNLGFARACNLGLHWIEQQQAQAIVWLINPDAYLLVNSLKEIKLFFDSHPELSIVGTMIYTPSKEVWFAGGRFIQKTGHIFSLDLLTHSESAYVKCDWLSGCSLLINLGKFDQCPQFDSAYFLYYEDFDFCMHYASLGHIIAVTKHLSAIHHPSTITNRNLFGKYQHSTYSYLLSLEKYTNKFVLLLRLIRLLAHALALIPIKPKIAFGKLYGILIYLTRSHSN